MSAIRPSVYVLILGAIAIHTVAAAGATIEGALYDLERKSLNKTTVKIVVTTGAPNERATGIPVRDISPSTPTSPGLVDEVIRKDGMFKIEVPDNGRDLQLVNIRFSRPETRDAVTEELRQIIIAPGKAYTIDVAVPEPPELCRVVYRSRHLFRRFRCAVVEPSIGRKVVTDRTAEAIAAIVPASVPASVGLGGERVAYSSQVRNWTNHVQTVTVRARFMDIADGVAMFQRDDGRIARSRVERLSATDREWIRKWQAEGLVAALPAVPATR